MLSASVSAVCGVCSMAEGVGHSLWLGLPAQDLQALASLNPLMHLLFKCD